MTCALFWKEEFESNPLLRKAMLNGYSPLRCWMSIAHRYDLICVQILIPLGAVIARYLKVFKSTDPAWFYLHVSCETAAYIVGVTGWGTGLTLDNDSAGITYKLEYSSLLRLIFSHIDSHSKIT